MGIMMQEMFANIWVIFVVIAPILAFVRLIRLYHEQKKNPSPPSPLAQLLLGNPEIKAWLNHHLSGERIADVKAIRTQFGLDLNIAVDLLDVYQQSVQSSLKNHLDNEK